jgi:hypothetical protein
MRPIVVGPDTPRTIDDFAVDWSHAVAAHAPIAEARHPYLGAVARYSNDGGVPDGIFAIELLLADDRDLARLLSLVHALPGVQTEVVPRLLARTAAREALTGFAREPAELERRLREARFAWIDPFLLEGTLARHLYTYGMYEYFYQHHDAAEACALARALLRDTVGERLEEIVAFDAQGSWRQWFDEHSCTDRTFVLLNRASRVGAVLCFSHSD